MHTKEDPIDKDITYGYKELIDEKKKQGFDVLAITLHYLNPLFHEMKSYAEMKGILLIPGAERIVEGKETDYEQQN